MAQPSVIIRPANKYPAFSNNTTSNQTYHFATIETLSCGILIKVKEEAKKSFFHDKNIWQNAYRDVTNGSKGV